jgi:hypothetical protein
MNFELPATGRDQAPAFLAAEDCRDWRSGSPSIRPAQTIVLRQQALIIRPPVAERLAILEDCAAVCSSGRRARNFAAACRSPRNSAQVRWKSNLLALGYLRSSTAADGRS